MSASSAFLLCPSLDKRESGRKKNCEIRSVTLVLFLGEVKDVQVDMFCTSFSVNAAIWSQGAKWQGSETLQRASFDALGLEFLHSAD